MDPSGEEVALSSGVSQVAESVNSALMSSQEQQIQDDSQEATINTDDDSDQDEPTEDENEEQESGNELASEPRCHSMQVVSQFDQSLMSNACERELKQQVQVQEKQRGDPLKVNQQKALKEAHNQQLFGQRNQQHLNHHHHHHQQQQQQQQQQQTISSYEEEVKQVELFGVSIVALTINGKQRLCLAQISNTLLKDLSYNEIHNRRVALGITCIQCTPIQLEILRRAGAMPSSSRRCGMITLREAERLCRSFLVEEQPPELPENFYFTVGHKVNYGCKGRFVPARYISSRAKCIECFYCGEFYSPNKFIFHSHRQPHNTDCNPPDSPNINSWRKHIDLDWTHEHSQEIKYAWEDVKSLFNGGTRRRAPNNNNNNNSCNGANQAAGATGQNCSTGATRMQSSANQRQRQQQQQQQQVASKVDDSEQLLIDVECDSNQLQAAPQDCSEVPLKPVKQQPSDRSGANSNNNNNRSLTRNCIAKSWAAATARYHQQPPASRQASVSSSLILPDPQAASKAATANSMVPVKRFLPAPGGREQVNNQSGNKRFMSASSLPGTGEDSFRLYDKVDAQEQASLLEPERTSGNLNFALNLESTSNSSPGQISAINQMRLPGLNVGGGGPQVVPARSPYSEFLALPSNNSRASLSSRHLQLQHQQQQQQHQQQQQQQHTNGRKPTVVQQHSLTGGYPSSNSLTSNFIYSQLYTQLMQPQQQQANLQQAQQQQQIVSTTTTGTGTGTTPTSAMNAQLALRNHLWSSLLALQCNAGGQQQQAYSNQQAVGQCATPTDLQVADSSNQLSHLISASQLYNPQSSLAAAAAAAAAAAKLHQAPNQTGNIGGYEASQVGPFSLHKFSSGETNDI